MSPHQDIVLSELRSAEKALARAAKNVVLLNPSEPTIDLAGEVRDLHHRVRQLVVAIEQLADGGAQGPGGS
jgi:hypothetical protein